MSVCTGAIRYLQMEFATATDSNGSFAFGSVTDGIYKLRVRIVAYTANEKLIRGGRLRLKGLMHDDESEFFFPVYIVAFDLNFFVNQFNKNFCIY